MSTQGYRYLRGEAINALYAFFQTWFLLTHNIQRHEYYLLRLDVSHE